MPRVQPLLHEAMQTILIACHDRTATIEYLSEENAKRDLYRRGKGDGILPPPKQFRDRARQRPDWFELAPPNKIRYIGPSEDN